MIEETLKDFESRACLNTFFSVVGLIIQFIPK